MDIDKYLFRDEALRGEKLALKFRWILIVVVLAFVVITFLRGHIKEASYALIPSSVFLGYNLLLSYYVKIGKNIYSLRYFSTTLDILILTVHIFINSVFFSDIAVSTTASIFIYPILMFLSVLRYDKKLIVYATFLSIVLFNINYYLRFSFIDPHLIDQVISSDPIGHTYKSGYLLLMGIFFLQVPNLVYRYISKQKKSLLKKNKIKLDLAIEQKEKGLLKTNLDELHDLNKEMLAKNQEIKEKNDLLKELNSTNDKLLSFISHDMKNSFSTMASIIETFSENYQNLDSNDIKDALKVLSRHSKTNYQLFENLLQWARSKSGELPLIKDEIDLYLFLNSVQELYTEALAAKDIEMEILFQEGLKVFADRYMLDSIVGNLISNALKFTPEGGKIEIDAVTGERNVLLSVKDTGIGIPEEALKNVFSVGASIHSVGTNQEKGSGFGLILCSELIRRNGGNIFVKSKTGEGSVFSITLPHS